MSTFAKADAKTQWFAGAYPGARITPNCGVIHTTETTGWPGYQGGKDAPNYSARPDMKAKRLAWRAHFPDEMSSRALLNLAGGVETNTANAVQVELVGTCDPDHSKTWGSLRAGVDYIFWPAAPDWALAALAEFLLDMKKRHGIPLSGVKTWLPYPKSYGSAGGQRMTFAQWRAFKGWCGHQHVPENDHGDPGALNFARVLALASPAVQSEEDELMAITVQNPVTGEQWPLAKSLWSSWTYSYNAARDAGAALAIVKAMAAKGGALTADEIEAAAKAGATAALDERIDSASVQLNVKES